MQLPCRLSPTALHESPQLCQDGFGSIVRLIVERLGFLTTGEERRNTAAMLAGTRLFRIEQKASDAGMHRQSGHPAGFDPTGPKSIEKVFSGAQG